MTSRFITIGAAKGQVTTFRLHQEKFQLSSKKKIVLAMKVILKSTEKCQERLSNIILGDLQKIYIQGPSRIEVDHLVHSS